MKFALRLIADLCFYFTFAPLLDIMLPTPVWVLPAAVYAVYLAVSYKKISNANYKPIFMLYLMAFGALSASAFLISAVYYVTILPVAMLFFASATTLMRLSRYDLDVQVKMPARLISSIPVCGLFLAAGLLASPQFRGFLGRVYITLIVPVLLLFARVFVTVFYVFFEWLRRVFENAELPTPDNSPPQEAMLGEGFEYIAQRESNILAIISFIAIPIALLLIFLLLRKLLRAALETVADRYADQEYIPLDEVKKQRIPKTKNKIRRYYQRFLTRCWKKGVDRKNYFTSKTYQTLATKKFGAGSKLNNELSNELQQLRDIYLPARYGNNPDAKPPKADIDFVKKVVSTFTRKN